jgi:hypothetical protein
MTPHSRISAAVSTVAVLLCLIAASSFSVFAQQSAVGNAVVPTLVQFSGVLTGGNGKPLTGITGVTFSLYAEQNGGAPLWLETQNVQPDKAGNYFVMLGFTTSQGLPSSLFVSGQARWLEVQAQGQGPQPRVMLMSVPYALKAGDAQTIGGLPPSAFVLAAPPTGETASAQMSGAAASQNITPNGSSDVTTSGGTPGTIPFFSTATDIENSVITQTGTGSKAKVGINNSSPSTTLDIKGSSTLRGTLSLPATKTATATQGYDSQPVEQSASAYNSSTGAAVAENFEWQAEPVGNDTATTSGTLNLLFSTGSNKFAETGLNIASNGQITFAAGQSFPGTGTITGVTAGSGLTGGGTSGKVTLSVPNAGITNAMLANSSLTVNPGGGMTGGGKISLGGSATLGLENCSANQVLEFVSGAWTCTNAATGTVTSVGSGAGLTGGPITGSGTLSVATGGVTNAMLQNSSLTVNPGTALTGGGAISLGGSTTLNVDTTKVPLLASANTFAANQTVNGNLSATGVVTGSGFQIGSNLFDYGSYANANAFTGFAGNTTTTGTNNTASGVQALNSNTTGGQNTASGYQSLPANTTGFANTASGYQSLYYTTGNANTGSGYSALYYNGSGSNNTGVGTYAGSPVDKSKITGTFDSFLGAGTGPSTGTLSYATAIGAYAEVAESNAMVLGSISGVNGCTSPCASTMVGIGTTTPANQLDVYAQSDVTAFNAVGFSVQPNSGLSGSSGVSASGGYGDPNGDDAGGDGIDAVGGTGGFNNGVDGNGGTFTGGNYAEFGDGVVVSAGSGYAGFFAGDVNVTGNLSKGGGSFKIDHPLDPANKYLYHSFVESPDMKNIYDGVVTLDGNGEAVVDFPEWFGVLNRDFRYQLTCIGGFAPVYVAEKISDNHFKIAGGKPGLEVSWQVTGIRQDAWANAHRIPVEEEKGARLKGFYIHPELYGQPDEKQIEWARHPQMMKKMKEMKEKQKQQAGQLRQQASAQPLTIEASKQR